MKKITFLLLAIIPLLGFSQTFDFTNTDDGWTEVGGFLTTNDASFITLTTKDNTVDGTLKNPTFATLSAGVDTSVNTFVGVTLKNNDATGPDYLRVSFLKPAGGRVYKNMDISTGDASFVTYWFDMSNANWTGTMDDIKLHFKAAGNSDYTLPVPQVTIDIDKIEFAASIPTTLKETYNFSSNGDAEGFSATNGSISGPTGGILTFTPVAAKFAKLEQLAHHVDADAHKQIHITLKNNSALNDQLRLVGGGETSTLTMTTSDATEKTYSFDMTAVAGWTGNQVFTIGIGSLADGKATDAGTVEFSSVIIDNTLSTKSNGITSFSLYPNPAKNVLNINSINKISKVTIFEITGKRVLEAKELTDSKINISQINTGIYIVKIQDEFNNISTKKLVID